MRQNAQANQNLCMAIRLQLKEDEFVPANQVGDWILCAELITKTKYQSRTKFVTSALNIYVSTL